MDQVHPPVKLVDGDMRGEARFDRESIDHFIARHGAEALSVARRFSNSADDAEDAYQTALERMMTKAPDVGESQMLPWLLTVVRNEALMIHRRRRKLFGGSFDDISANWATESAELDEQVIDSEAYAVGREALRRLRPDQMRCLLLRADGLSYEEICGATGFSYTKVNRCLSEGRKAFRSRVGLLESGAECRRVSPLLSMIADGEADTVARNDARLHLDGCASCQATLREYTTAAGRVAALAPLGTAVTGDDGGAIARFGDWVTNLAGAVQERVFGHAAVATQQPAAEMVLAKKIAAVAAITATLAAGGATVEKVVDDGPSEDRAAEPDNRAEPTPESVSPVTSEVGGDAKAEAARRDRPKKARADDVASPPAGSGAAQDSPPPDDGQSLGQQDPLDQHIPDDTPAPASGGGANSPPGELGPE